MLKLQSAMEYLTTYGWAILIIGIALVVIFGLISQQPQSQTCLPPAGFSCINYFMAQNGLLYLNLLQATQDPIQITALGCNTPESVGQMDYGTSYNTGNQVDTFPTTAPANIPIGANYTFAVQCYSGTTRFLAR